MRKVNMPRIGFRILHLFLFHLHLYGVSITNLILTEIRNRCALSTH